MKGSKLDLIFSNSDHIKNALTLDYNISDHMAVVVTRKKSVSAREKVEFKGRSYRRYVKEDFQNNLSEADWEVFYNEEDPNRLWEIMEKEIIKQADIFCPIKAYRVSALREPWITNEAIEGIKDIDRLLRRAKKSGKVQDWEEARRARNQVGRDMENFRSDFLKNQQEINKADPKTFWKTISSIFPTKAGKINNVWLKDSEDGSYIESHNTTDYINRFFTNIGPKLAEKHNERWQYFGENVQEDITAFHTNIDEVKKLCREINTMKSSGIDELSLRLCKDAFLVLGHQLVHPFNRSLISGCFPDKWKVAKIVPVFKGGHRADVSNYRPVSLLP